MSEHLGRWDVVVCGGGTAGAVAAIASAREGARTIVVERYGALGGTQTQGWVTPMMPNYLGDFKLDRGVNLEVVGAQAAEQPPGGSLAHGDVWYDPLGLALVLDRLAAEAGVTCLFDATLCAAEVEGGRVRSVSLMTHGGAATLEGACFVDCTGDATLCHLAGARTMGGDATGEHQPMTLRFTMGGIDLERARTENPGLFRLDEPGFLEAGFKEMEESAFAERVRGGVARGALDVGDLGYFQVFTMNGRPGELAFNCPRLAGFDPLDPLALSRAYAVGRAKVARIAAFVREEFAGFERAYVSAVAPLIGIRESRRVVGEYVLTGEDHAACRKFDDAIARNRYPVDIHLVRGVDLRPLPAGEWHDIPYRSLTVAGFENLWVAGRCASADFVAQSAIRIQPVCRSMGQAAGVAAALASLRGWSSRDVPYGELAARLDLSLPSDPGLGAE